MQTRFTPGPWRANSSWIEGPRMALRVAVVDGPARASAPVTKEEAAANARLIAATPDLYEAAVAIVDHLNATHVPAPLIDALRSAIRKAGGKA